jgi:adenosine kinase
VPTYVDPSHGLPILERDELVELIYGAAVYFANDYEWSLTLQQTGASEDEITARCGAVVITRGAEGSEIRAGGETLRIPPVTPERVVDPTGCGDAYRAGFLCATGCGDAYRAGFLCGVSRGYPLDVAGRMGSLFGAWQVEVQGTQSLSLGDGDFRRRYREVFGSPL